MDLRFGVLASTAANFSMNKDPDKRALVPGDFFPSVASATEAAPMDPDMVLAVFQAMKSKPN